MRIYERRTEYEKSDGICASDKPSKRYVPVYGSQHEVEIGRRYENVEDVQEPNVVRKCGRFQVDANTRIHVERSCKKCEEKEQKVLQLTNTLEENKRANGERQNRRNCMPNGQYKELGFHVVLRV